MRDALAGATVVLTREPEDSASLAERLRALAATVIELPCVGAEPPEDPPALADALASLRDDDWLVVTSRHGADAVARAGRPRGRIAAVGPATAERLRAHGVVVSFEPSAANGERLARELPHTPGGAVLLARSDRALPDLPAILRERGFAVREVVAYRTVIGPRGDVERVRALLSAGREAVAVVFYSPSAVEGLLRALEPALLARATIFVAGRATWHAVNELVGPSADIAFLDEEVPHGPRV